MKKLENNPEWIDGVELLRKLQEIQRDVFGKNKVGLEIDVEPEGKYIVAHAYTFKNGKVNKYLHLHLSSTYSSEKLKLDYEKLTDFIKEHSA